MDQLIEQLKRHEGFKAHVYRCSAGKLSIGYGYNLQANPLKLSSIEINHLHTNGIDEFEAERLLKLMIARITDQLEQAIPFINHLNPARQDVIINMAYNMGLPGLLKFKKTLVLIEAEDYAQAAKEMLNSKWYTDVGHRAVELAEQMKLGAC